MAIDFLRRLACHPDQVSEELVWCPANKFTKMERFADTESGTGFTLTREEDPSSRWSSGRIASSAAVRDASTAFALLTALSMTRGTAVR